MPNGCNVMNAAAIEEHKCPLLASRWGRLNAQKPVLCTQRYCAQKTKTGFKGREFRADQCNAFSDLSGALSIWFFLCSWSPALMKIPVFFCSFPLKNSLLLSVYVYIAFGGPLTWPILQLKKPDLILKSTTLFSEPVDFSNEKHTPTTQRRRTIKRIIAFINTNTKEEIISGGFVTTVHWHMLWYRDLRKKRE